MKACDKKCVEVMHMTGGRHRTDCVAYAPDPSPKGWVTIFLDHGNCQAWWIIRDAPATPEQAARFAMFGPSLAVDQRSGFTERNIGELVKAFVALDYHVTLYRVGQPEYHANGGQQ